MSHKTRAEEYEARLAMPSLEPSFNDDGVDLTQIRWMLSLTPLERLRYVEEAANSIETMLAVVRVIPPGETNA